MKLEREEARWQAEQEKLIAQQLEEEARLEAMTERDHAAMQQWARSRVSDPLVWVVLDTETTGLEAGSEIVQIAVVRGDGVVLLDSLVKPTQPIPDEVTQIHGITDADVRDAPGFLEVWPRVLEAIGTRDLLIYNASFDLMMLRFSLELHGLKLELVGHADEKDGFTGDMVQRFLRAGREVRDRRLFTGEWSRRRGTYRWSPLGGSHRGVEDCREVLRLLKDMARRQC